MAKFLTTSGISYQIEEIIKSAKNKLVIVSPYLKLSKNLLERLKDASNLGKKIIIIYGKKELEKKEENSLGELDNLELFFSENLHAKCYFNETTMIITSMNVYEFSEKNNREMGILIDKGIDTEIFNDAIKEVQSIIANSKGRNISRDKRIVFQKVNTGVNSSRKLAGHCIRCSKRISHNPEKPYCNDCFGTWVAFENWEYEENHCHSCGKFESTSMEKPLCYSCFKNSSDMF